MRALITGASGFLGQHLCSDLLSRGDFVVALVRDISWRRIERAIAEYEIDTVFHLAAQTQVSVAAAHPVGTLEANVRGTWEVLEACRRQKVKRVIVASSDKAYGRSPAPYTEETPLQAHGIYATSKACTDMIAQAYGQEYGMSIAITRCGNLYGPGHLNWSTLIPGTIRSVLRGERPVLRSDGTLRRDYLHVADAAAGCVFLAERVGYDGAYNFGTGIGTSAREVVELILSLTKSKLEVWTPMAATLGGVEIQEQIVDALKALAAGWTPKYPRLEDGLPGTIDWYRAHFRAQLRDRQVDFGPITGKKGQTLQARSIPHFRFKASQFRWTDTFDRPGCGTAIRSVFVGCDKQVHDGGDWDTCVKGVEILIEVEFLEDCTWSGTAFGGAL